MILLTLISLNAQAEAPPRYSVGLQVALAKDLPDRVEHSESAEFLIGPAFIIPARMSVLDGLLHLRAGLEIHTAAGMDRLTWVDGETTFYKDEQEARLWAAHLLLGPEVRAPTGEGSPVSPYLSVGLGPGRVRTTHPLELETAGLLAEPVDADSPASDFLARTRQWVPSVGAQGGIRVDFGSVAAELEAGYTVSFVSEAPLSNTDEAYEVHREAYGLDVFRLGLGFSLPF